MIKQILEFLRDILRTPSLHDALEAYITAGNPQTPDDVDRLEREFFRNRESLFFDRYQ
jgi:hypothetical protein